MIKNGYPVYRAPREEQKDAGVPREEQEDTGVLREDQKDTGEPQEEQKDAGEPREEQEDAREPREEQEDAGEPREEQEDTGEPRKEQEDVGESQEEQEDAGEQQEKRESDESLNAGPHACRVESDHFPQTLELAHKPELLQSSNDLVSLPELFNLKRLKWREKGIATVMDEVYQMTGALGERKTLADMHLKEPTLNVDWNKDWAVLCDGLLAKILATFNLTFQGTSNVSNRDRVSQPWFNKALRNQKLQIARQTRKMVKATQRGEGEENHI
ncbi:hypothetical protein NDU88_006385 [Pleurodeles waltl]|uniref:Uncharacterized protein n=1 Tax=Pleurodeles waltl TaxID=8319 RepID=A0AAV7TXI3_PLEWA|nr:hypothetical protein NDU88_006385 [Pleurodeles waltl]